MHMLRRSYQLSRFHLAIVICLLAILVAVFLRYASMVEASLEQVSVQINLLNLQQMTRFQNMLTQQSDPHCSYLNKPDLFTSIGIAGMEVSPVDNRSGAWQYDPRGHRLTYFVRSKRYFKSDNGQKIDIDLYCKQGLVFFKVSRFQWCQDKRIWGCAAW